MRILTLEVQGMRTKVVDTALLWAVLFFVIGEFP